MNVRSTIGKILDKLTRLLRLDVRFYAKAANLFAWSQASLLLRGIATTYLMALWLPRETFGAFRYVIALSGFAGIFSMGGMGSGVVRAVAKGDTGVVHSVYRSMAKFAPLGSLLLVIFSIVPFLQGDLVLGFSILCAAIAFVPQCLGQLYPQILTGKAQLKRLAIITTISNVGFAIFFISALLYSHHLLWMTATYFFLDAAWKFIPTLIEISRLPKTKAIEDTSHLTLSRHMNAITMLQTVAFQIDSILVKHFAGYQALAAFSVATALPDQMRGLIGQFGNTFLQRLSRPDAKSNVQNVRRHFWTGFGVSGSMAILYAVSAPVIFHLFLPKYSDQVIPSLIYGLSIAPIIPTLIGSNFAQSTSQIKTLWTIYSWNGIIQFFCDIILIPIFGAWGAIAAKMISRFAGVPFCYPKEPKNSEQQTKNG